MTLLLETSWEFEAAFIQLRKLLPQAGRCQICHIADETLRNFTTIVRLAEYGMVLKPPELTHEGTIILDLLEKLFFTLDSTPETDHLLKRLALSCGVWVAQQGGSLQELSLLVNAVATFANQRSHQQDLEALYEASIYLLVAADDFIKADLDKRDTLRPWRLLNLNHGIIATRTNNVDLIKRAYAYLVQHLPEESANFFAMARQKVQNQQQHPPHVRTLVQQYYQMFAEHPHQPQREALALH